MSFLSWALCSVCRITSWIDLFVQYVSSVFYWTQSRDRCRLFLMNSFSVCCSSLVAYKHSCCDVLWRLRFIVLRLDEWRRLSYVYQIWLLVIDEKTWYNSWRRYKNNLESYLECLIARTWNRRRVRKFCSNLECQLSLFFVEWMIFSWDEWWFTSRTSSMHKKWIQMLTSFFSKRATRRISYR